MTAELSQMFRTKRDGVAFDAIARDLRSGDERVLWDRGGAAFPVGWSPDGIIEGIGSVEIKCPLHKAWMACKKAMKIPAEYRWQTRWGMWVGQLELQDFVMYHPMTGGIVIPCEVTAEEKEQMEERVALLETKVAPWVEIIGNSRNTFRPSPQVEAALDIADATF